MVKDADADVRVTLRVPSDAGDREVVVGPAGWSEFSIGRGEGAQLFLNHPTVSRKHCRLVLRDRAVVVEDLKSRMGTFVGDRRVEGELMLADGDRLRVGDIVIGVGIVDPQAVSRAKAAMVDTAVPSAPKAKKEERDDARKEAERKDADAAARKEAERKDAEREEADRKARREAQRKPTVLPPPPEPPAPPKKSAAHPPKAEEPSREPVSPHLADRTIISKGDELTATAVKVDLSGKAKVTFGRDSTSDVALDNPLVSRSHAEVRREGDGFVVADLGSTNGTFVNGERVRKPHRLQPNDLVAIGPYALRFDGKRLATGPAKAGTRIEVRGIGKQVNDRATGKPLYLLKDVSLTILPKEFVGLLGASGCGKSTFMDTVNGRRPATEGSVLYDGENLYNQFDRFKRGIGYVPQELIFHDGLPVADALRYASRLRLPDDTSEAEIEENIDRVLKVVGLVAQKETLVKFLSGGQKKRVSIAMELLSRPTLLFLDEATSGLDLGTEAQMMRLFRELADGGVTTLCITHYVDSLDACDVVAYFVRGRLAFFGPPAELKKWFAVSAIREVYLKEADKTPEEWEKSFRESTIYKKYVLGRASPPVPADATRVMPGQALELSRPRDLKRQATVLTKRYVQLILGDRKAFWIALGLAPAIGLLVSLVLSGKTGETEVELAQRLGKLSFILTIVSCFMGLFGAIREVVKELPVYRHERFINLEIGPYLASKILPLAVIGALQVFALLVVVHLLSGMQGSFIGHFVALTVVSIASSLLGLAISSAVDSSDKAVMLMIFVVIPQFILSNAIISLAGFGKFLAIIAILCYWGHDAVKSTFSDRLLELRIPGGAGAQFEPRFAGFDNAGQPRFDQVQVGGGGGGMGGKALFGHNGWFLDFLMLVVFAAIYGGLAYYFLRKKDGPTGKPFVIPFLKKGTWFEARRRGAWAAKKAFEGIMWAVRAGTKAVAKLFDKNAPPPTPGATPPA